MPLPDFNEVGDLPEGVHRATVDEVAARFGGQSARRHPITERLLRIHQTAAATGKLDRLIIFGSYVSNKQSPNDVDIVLVMRDDFELADCDAETGKLFEHGQAEIEFEASVFWIRPALLVSDTLDEFIAYWQIKRDGARRGIVEVIA
jgi:predicted nucleotidyltransferase